MCNDNEDLLKKELNNLKKITESDPGIQETKISEWIRKNKALLITGGSITAAGGKAIAWIVEHMEEIKAITNEISKGFQSKTLLFALDIDLICIGNETLLEAFDNDSILINAALQRLQDKYGFETVNSQKHNLIKLGIHL